MNLTVPQVPAFENPYAIFNNRYVVRIKIKDTPPNQSWWYVACCNCNRKVRSHGHGSNCANPQCVSTSGCLRYSLSAIAVDPSASIESDAAPSIELVFFGDIAEQIIGAPVANLVNDGTTSGPGLPMQLTKLLGQVFRVCIGVSSMSLQKDHITYQVHSVMPIPKSGTFLSACGKFHTDSCEYIMRFECLMNRHRSYFYSADEIGFQSTVAAGSAQRTDQQQPSCGSMKADMKHGNLNEGLLIAIEEPVNKQPKNDSAMQQEEMCGRCCAACQISYASRPDSQPKQQ